MAKVILLDRTTTIEEYTDIVRKQLSLGYTLVKEEFDGVWHCHFAPIYIHKDKV